jgi:CheY-like chemotaxis protein
MVNEMLLAQLRAAKLVSEEGLRAAVERAGSTGEDLASACFSLKLAPEAALVRELCRLHGYPGVDLSGSVIRLSNLAHVPDDVMRRKLVLPLLDSGAELVVAMAEPDDAQVYDELRFLTGRKVLRHVAVLASLREAIEGALRARDAGEPEWRGRDAWKIDPPAEGEVAFVHPAEGAPAADLPLVLGKPLEDLSWTDGFQGRVQMPERKVEAAPARPAPLDPQTTVKVDAIGAGKTVLVVDDDLEMRQMEVKIIEPLGCAVLQTGDGREALSLCREAVPNVVLLDAMLPGMHGFEVCRAIKGDSTLRAVGIVMISGIYTGWRIGADLKEAYGADYFFEKPFRIPELSRAVRVLLLGGVGAQALSRARREEALATCRQALTRAQIGKHSEAIGLLQSAVQKDPFSAEPHYFLGQVLRQAGQPYQAVAALERAADLRPDLDQPLTLLGELYLALGFRKTARDVFSRALEACSDENRGRQIQARLAALGKA